MIGQTIAHYRVTEKIGEGGMGVVYKADDLKLKRTVALKFLSGRSLNDEDQRSRFLREAQAAAGLDHSNICTVYAVDEVAGKAFIAMAHLEGPSLQDRIAAGPLEIDEALDIAQQVTQGLRAAHRNDVVHRDIKPANVIFTKEGVAKIVDFGLAQLGGEGRLTKEGVTVGTTAYMSPEQAMAKPLDQRTDVWSLGVLIYELVTGQAPFLGHYGDAIVYSIVNEQPEPMSELRSDVPTALQQIVSKALAKNPDERFQNMDEMLADLQSLRGNLASGTVEVPVSTARPVGRKWKLALSGAVCLLVALLAMALFNPAGRQEAINSIAVLPLDNLSADPEQDYFVNGMHEALIAELAQIRALTVISRTSVNRYRGTDKSIPEIADELNVDAVVEGSVLRVGDSVRITAQLIGTAPERHLWARSYDRDLRDVLSLQSQVAMAVAKEIQVAVTPEEEARLASTRPVDPEVYRHHLLGRQLCSSQIESELYRGVDQFRQAIERDPSYAPSHAGLARCYSTLAMFFLPPSEAAPRAQAALNEALRLDDELAEAHAVNGFMKLFFDRDFSGGKDFERALQLDPNSVTALLDYAWYLAASARFDEAVTMNKRAVDLDPLGPTTVAKLGWITFVARRYDESILHFQKALELDSNLVYGYAFLSVNYVMKGMAAEATAAVEKAEALAPSSEDQNLLNLFGWVYASLNRKDDAHKILDQLDELSPRRHINPASPAAIHAALGDADSAFQLLSEAGDGDGALVLLKEHPMWDPLRSDPRFDELLNRLGLGK
jgi:TolB-like protein/tetratricopeptide (TPR) repeat protein/tRNA A-37 threonylcarbamoyl transferase component Bud32